eukprot:752427-Hanusia_phi.AAC.2
MAELGSLGSPRLQIGRAARQLGLLGVGRTACRQTPDRVSALGLRAEEGAGQGEGCACGPGGKEEKIGRWGGG